MLFLQFIVLPHNYLLRNCYLQQSRRLLRLRPILGGLARSRLLSRSILRGSAEVKAAVEGAAYSQGGCRSQRSLKERKEVNK
jgi:hypothetical protein